MAKTPTEIRSLARSHTEKALNCLVGVMENSTSDPAKVSAATALLDRGWGKPTQPLSGDADGPPIKFTKIELVGVRPADQDT
jgi:hypothetical protein